MLHIRRKAEIEVICSASASIITRHEDESQPLEHFAKEDEDLAVDLDIDLDTLTLQRQKPPDSEATSDPLPYPPDVMAETGTTQKTLTGAPLLATYLIYKINAAIDDLRSLSEVEPETTHYMTEGEGEELVFDMEDFV